MESRSEERAAEFYNIRHSTVSTQKETQIRLKLEIGQRRSLHRTDEGDAPDDVTPFWLCRPGPGTGPPALPWTRPRPDRGQDLRDPEGGDEKSAKGTRAETKKSSLNISKNLRQDDVLDVGGMCTIRL